jgi:hypothetical protein
MRRFLAFAFVLCVLIASAGPSAAGGLEMGLAVVDITPPVGYRMCGYFNERLSTGVHDPLYAKALVLRQGDRKAAMVFCDLIAVSRSVSAKVREEAAKKIGVPELNILAAATHSHTGPLYAGAMRDFMHGRAVARDGTDPCEKVDYAAELTARLVRAIGEADAALKPVKLQAGSGRETGLSFNRRFLMKDGATVFNPGKKNPNIVRVAGPIDPEVGLLLFRDAAGGPLASLTVFALHLDTVGGTLYSADYPFYLEETLRKELGSKFVSMFGNGTCGDINHIDVSTDRPQPGGVETKRIGEALGRRVHGELARLKEAVPRLAVRSEVIRVPLQKVTPDDVAWARKAMEKVGTAELPFLEQVRAYKIMDLHAMPDPLPVLVQTFRVSDEVAIVGLPGEVFVDLGLAIKRASPFGTTMVMELCNDAPDYVPTKKAFAEGSYETVNSRVVPGGGETIAETAVRLLTELKAAP